MKFSGRHRQKLNTVFQDSVFERLKPREEEREFAGIKEARDSGVLFNCRKLFLWNEEVGRRQSARLYLAS